MVPPGGRLPVSGGHDKLDAQHEQWQSTFRGNPDMYGTDPSEPGAYAAGLFSREQIRDLLELGAGQGRDTLTFLRAGLTVTALDYATSALTRLQQAATDAGLADQPTTVAHDVRHHFFDRALVDRLATGFTLLDLSAFEEGSLPRRLWRITLRREGAP
jgi:cyclopropane fatty-acyl-phospholipid synthase-like methyltransferase